MQTSVTAFETEIAGALAASLAADAAEARHRADASGYMVAYWLAGDKHEAARAYVLSYFAQFGETPRIVETQDAPDEMPGMMQAVNVHFCQYKGAGTDVFTVWLEEMENGPFVYGEW